MRTDSSNATRSLARTSPLFALGQILRGVGSHQGISSQEEPRTGTSARDGRTIDAARRAIDAAAVVVKDDRVAADAAQTVVAFLKIAEHARLERDWRCRPSINRSEQCAHHRSRVPIGTVAHGAQSLGGRHAARFVG